MSPDASDKDPETMARRAIIPFAVLGAFAVLGILSSAACHDQPAGASGPEAVTDTVDGVPRLTYPGTGGPTLDWSLDTLVVIGDLMGTDEHYMLGQVGAEGIAGDDAGDLFVLDAAAFHVVSYDSTGSYLATYGRHGNGPGEISQGGALGLGPGDTIWVEGITSRRLTGFPIRGGDARTVMLPGVQFFLPPLVPLSGGFLTQGYPLVIPLPGSELEDPGILPVVSVHPDGTEVDTVWSRPAPKRDMVHIKVAGRTTTMPMTPMFSPALRWDAFADGSIAIASDDSYTIRLLRPDGSERMLLARDLPPAPVGDRERELARQQLRAGYANTDIANNPTVMEMIESQIEAMTFAPTIPRITGIRVDAANRIWVAVSLSWPDSTQRIDVFERDGSLLGTIEGMKLPATFYASDRAATLRTDPDTDVQQVVVMRLREGAGD